MDSETYDLELGVENLESGVKIIVSSKSSGDALDFIRSRVIAGRGTAEAASRYKNLRPTLVALHRLISGLEQDGFQNRRVQGPLHNKELGNYFEIELIDVRKQEKPKPAAKKSGGKRSTTKRAAVKVARTFRPKKSGKNKK